MCAAVDAAVDADVGAGEASMAADVDAEAVCALDAVVCGSVGAVVDAGASAVADAAVYVNVGANVDTMDTHVDAGVGANVGANVVAMGANVGAEGVAADGTDVVTLVRGGMLGADAGSAGVLAAVCLGSGAVVDAGVGAAFDTGCDAAMMVGWVVGEAAGGAGVQAVILAGVGTAIDGGGKVGTAADGEFDVVAAVYDDGKAGSGGAGDEVGVGADVPAALGAGEPAVGAVIAAVGAAVRASDVNDADVGVGDANDAAVEAGDANDANDAAVGAVLAAAVDADVGVDWGSSVCARVGVSVGAAPGARCHPSAGGKSAAWGRVNWAVWSTVGGQHCRMVHAATSAGGRSPCFDGPEGAIERVAVQAVEVWQFLLPTSLAAGCAEGGTPAGGPGRGARTVDVEEGVEAGMRTVRGSRDPAGVGYKQLGAFSVLAG